MKADTGKIQDLDDLLRRCVSCGLCLPHCATWAETGNETHSPRGRLLLLDDLLANPTAEKKAAYAEAFDLCIGCKACETACPGGVPYSLLDHGKKLVDSYTEKPGTWSEFLNRRLDSPAFLSLLRTTGRLSRQVLKRVWGTHWRQRLQSAPLKGDRLVRLLGSMPASPNTDNDLILLLDNLLGGKSVLKSREQYAGPTRDVAFFVSCANLGLLPASSGRLVNILEATGNSLLHLNNQKCCGALAAHTRRPGTAALQKMGNIRSMANLGPESIPVVVEAAGCGDHLKNYGPEFEDRVVDAAVLLSKHLLTGLREVPLKVVYHDPCHALHGQQIYHEPRTLLKQIPSLTLVEPVESDVCCGSGGAWAMQHPELSERLGRRKSRNLADTGADLVVTSNPGCLGQINDGLALEAPQIPILPLSDLLWFAMFTSAPKT